VLSVVSAFFTIGSVSAENSPVNAMDARMSFKAAVKVVSPAVVNIYAAKEVENKQASRYAKDTFFQGVVSEDMPGKLRNRVERSLGSGVVVTPTGYIITNAHVVDGSDTVKVVFNDQRVMNAEVISGDKAMDIAILRITDEGSEEFVHAVFADSDALEVGDVVLALGNPYGVGQSVSMGIVSAVGRSGVGAGQYENFIQTDAAINPGNSGGALVDSNGKLVGINTAIFTKTGGSQGISFAVPSNAVSSVLKSVLTTGKVTRPWFGAEGQNVTSALAEQLGLKTPRGVLINELVEGSPAQKGNIVVGDIITSFDGKRVDNVLQLSARVASAFVGENYALDIMRSGKLYKSEIMLGALPDRRIDEQHTIRGSNPLTGYVFEPLSPALNDELAIPLKTDGVVIVGVPTERRWGSLALKVGDVITNINDNNIVTIKDLKKSTGRRPKTWKILFQRDGRKHKVVGQ
jgi:serine protease Do